MPKLSLHHHRNARRLDPGGPSKGQCEPRLLPALDSEGAPVLKTSALAAFLFFCCAGVLAQNRIAISGAPPASAANRGGAFPAGRRVSIGLSGAPFESMHRRGFHRAPFFY